MGRVGTRVGGFKVACLGVVGLAGLGSLGAGMGAHSVGSMEPAPVDIIAARFMSEDTAPSEPTAFYTTASLPAREEDALFNPAPSYRAIPVAVDPDSVPPAEPATATVAPAPAVKTETATAPPPSAPHRRAAPSRPNAVFNDAQLVSIRTRLNLTPDQAEMWPAVEAALRSISYTRVPGAGGRGPQASYVDPYSPEVERLKSVAIPLLMRMSTDQRREVKTMAHVMGLDNLAAQL